MSKQKLLIDLAHLLETHLEPIAKANTADVSTCLQTNKDNLQRAIATLKEYAKRPIKNEKNETQGFSIYSCYGDPSFGLFGMSLAPALLANGGKVPILVGFPEILGNYAKLIEKIITQSQLFEDIKFVFGAKKFMHLTLSNPKIKHCLVFGDTWVSKYVEDFRYKKSLTYYGPGNNVAVLLPSNNLPNAIEKILLSAFILSGQAAVCINRCIIDNRLNKEEVKKIFNEKLKKIKYGLDTNNYVTPIVIEHLAKQVKNRIDEIDETKVQKINYNLLEKDKHYLFTPSLLWLEETNTAIWQNYHFAPILPIVFKNFSEIIDEINHTEYRIYASFWGENEKEITTLQKETLKTHIFALKNQSILDIISIENGYTGTWGGYKKSGFCLSKQTNWEVREGSFDFYQTLLHINTEK